MHTRFHCIQFSFAAYFFFFLTSFHSLQCVEWIFHSTKSKENETNNNKKKHTKRRKKNKTIKKSTTKLCFALRLSGAFLICQRSTYFIANNRKFKQVKLLGYEIACFATNRPIKRRTDIEPAMDCNDSDRPYELKYLVFVCFLYSISLCRLNSMWNTIRKRRRRRKKQFHWIYIFFSVRFKHVSNGYFTL